MATIRVATVLDAPPEEVWADLADISRHVEWMADATAIRLVGTQATGTGTRFECDTRIGPFALTDVMEVTEWVPSAAMGVRHTGLITGTGRFTLTEVEDARTQFQWEESLAFPWWLGGALGAAASKPVLRRVWRRNLTRLASRFT